MTGPGLLARLPKVRGRYQTEVDLGRMTWFKAGGTAEVLFRPLDGEDLATFLAQKPADVPLSIIGVGSNLLVRDGGVPGVVIRLGRGFTDLRVDGCHVTAGAAALDTSVATAAFNAGLANLEFLIGIPGTVGGALRMNAGAYNSDISDVLVSARALDADGRQHEIAAAEMGFGYRSCAVPPNWLFIDATLRGQPASRSEIAAKMDSIRDRRQDDQPIGSHTGGSTFANPPGAKAWELIEAAGCRGLRLGGAMVSTKHCNFLVNTGNATAADLENLGEDVRRRVQDHSGIRLTWEIRRIGRPAETRTEEIAR